MTRARSILVAVAVIVALQALAIGAYLAIDRSRHAPRPFMATPLAPTPAPTLVIEHRDRHVRELPAQAPRVRLVHFWATWCEPCRVELPALLARAAEVPDLELVAVSVDADWTTIARFFPDGVPPAIVRARAADAHVAFGARTLPDSYVIDRDGRLIERIAGARDWSRPEARAYLHALPRR